MTSVAKASSEFRPAYSFNKSKSLVVIFTSISARALEIRQNFDRTTANLGFISSRLYFPVFVAHFEADMKRLGLNSVLGGVIVLFAIQPLLPAETNDLPHFQEIFRLDRKSTRLNSSH